MYPRGVIGDVLENLILSIDFIIVDMEEDKRVPIVVWRPFLATGWTLIDVAKGDLAMWGDDKEATFKIF